MKELQELVINEIIHQLSPLRTLYQDDINNITTDLLNHKYDSLNKFLDTYYQDVLYTEPFQNFVKELVNKKIITEKYLIKMELSIPHTMIDTPNSFLSKGFTPLNVKKEQKENLQNKYQNEIKPIIPNQEEVIEIKDNEEIIKNLKEKILEAQLLYLNDVNGFIQKLEQYEPEDIYQELMNLNDIRYIQHCIKNLSTETQNSLLTFIEQKLKVEHHSIDAFIEEAIKKNIKIKK